MLKFIVRPGHMPCYPGQLYSGQFRQYAGRKTVVKDGVISHPATGEFAVEPQSDAGRRFVKMMRHDADNPPFYAADQATAAACSARYVPVEQGSDGEYYPAKPKKSS